jgi:hypothetical protein
MEYRSGRMTQKYRRWGNLARIALVAIAVGQQDHPTRERTDGSPLIVSASVSVTLPENASLSPTLFFLILLCD